MIWLVIYLYVVGAFVFWLNTQHRWVTLFWPVIVPVAMISDVVSDFMMRPR